MSRPGVLLIVALLSVSCGAERPPATAPLSPGAAQGAPPAAQTPDSPPQGESCPSGMAFVCGGGGEAAPAPGFCIDRYEYPNRKGEIPEGRVNWRRAGELCSRQGKRLCSGAEWVRACSGPSGTLHPYGQMHDPESCRSDRGWRAGPSPSGAYPTCTNAYGAFDMAGNLWEWTRDASTGDKGKRILRGGSWASRGGSFASCAAEIGNFQGIRLRYYGFRCCRDP